jgi:hypothetical protein
MSRRAPKTIGERMQAFLLCRLVNLSDDGTRMTVVHVHPDSASLEYHMEVAGPVFRQFVEFVTLSSIHVFGESGEKVLKQLHEKARLLGRGCGSGSGCPPRRREKPSPCAWLSRPGRRRPPAAVPLLVPPARVGQRFDYQIVPIGVDSRSHIRRARSFWRFSSSVATKGSGPAASLRSFPASI